MARTKKTSVIQKSNKTVIRKTIRKFPTVPEEKKEEKDNCCICISEIPKKKKASLDCCDHKFCKGCIQKWAETENSCPLCKRKFTTITSLKKGCKKKQETVEVEDKRQRPDDPQNPITFEELMQTPNEMLPALEMVIEYQVSRLNNEDIPAEAFNNMIQPQMISSEVQYTNPCRMNTIIYFTHCDEWRQNLLVWLQDSIRAVRDDEVTDKDIAVHMIFNVIDRYMRHACSRNPTMRNNLSDKLKIWMRIAKMIVFGPSGDNVHESIDIDDIVLRPEHTLLTDGSYRRSTHSHMLCAWCELTGIDPRNLLRWRDLEERGIHSWVTTERLRQFPLF